MEKENVSTLFSAKAKSEKEGKVGWTIQKIG